MRHLGRDPLVVRVAEVRFRHEPALVGVHHPRHRLVTGRGWAGEQRRVGRAQHLASHRRSELVPVRREPFGSGKGDVQGILDNALGLQGLQVLCVLIERRRHRGDPSLFEQLLIDRRDEQRHVHRHPDKRPVPDERAELRVLRCKGADLEVLVQRQEPLRHVVLAHLGPVHVRNVGEVGVGRRGGCDLGLQVVPSHVRPVDLYARLAREPGEHRLRRGGVGDGHVDRHVARAGVARGGRSGRRAAEKHQRCGDGRRSCLERCAVYPFPLTHRSPSLGA